MAEVTILFKDIWKEKLLNGKKSCTVRPEKKAEQNDTFDAFGATFKVLNIEEIELKFICHFYFSQDGFETEEGYIAFWKAFFGKDYDPERKCFVHWIQLQEQRPNPFVLPPKDDEVFRFKFGFYKGKTLQEIPTAYLEFFMEHLDGKVGGNVMKLFKAVSGEWLRRDKAVNYDNPDSDDPIYFPETDDGEPDNLLDIFKKDILELTRLPFKRNPKYYTEEDKPGEQIADEEEPDFDEEGE